MIENVKFPSCPSRFSTTRTIIRVSVVRPPPVLRRREEVFLFHDWQEARMTKNIYIPEGFDARTHLPESLWKDADAANYLLHIIEWNRVCYRRQRSAYIPLKAAYLNNVMGRQAKDIRTALEAGGAIDIDPQYFPGEKSRGYRLGPKLRDATFRRHLTTAKLAKKLKRHKMYKKPRLPIHKYLYSWLTRLEVDHQAAMHSLKSRGELIDKYIALDMIADRQFYMVPDDYGRLHTNVSSLSRTLRPFLHYGDDKLVLLDLKNSQPFFFSLLLLNYYANNMSLDSFYSYNTSEKKRKGRREKVPAITICILSMLKRNSLVKMDLPQDVKDYILLTETGKLYEELVKVFDTSDREEAKTALFKWVLFCKPRKNKYHSLFRDRFPSVSGVIDALKEKDHRRLSHHLQKCESAAMIHGVCGRLRDDFPDVPVWTIHDCVMTTKPFLEPVRTVVRDQFAALSLSPTISEQDFTLAA